jgi:hypothetical protein
VILSVTNPYSLVFTGFFYWNSAENSYKNQMYLKFKLIF